METVRVSREIVVLGGGCYGAYHAGQLLKARSRGRLWCDRILVIDHNPRCPAHRHLRGERAVAFVRAEWSEFLVEYVPQAPLDAQLVPAPLAPHVLADWLEGTLRRTFPHVRIERAPLAGPLHLPYDVVDARGNRYLSHAAWVCPSTCIEPEICPAIRGPRDWDLGKTVARRAEVPLVLFRCLHFVYGVGTIPIATLVQALDEVARPLRARGEAAFGVVTASHCHGVATLLRLTVPTSPEGRMR